MRATFVVLAMSVTLAAQTKLPPPADIKVDFEKDVQPILAQKCHSATEKMSASPVCDSTGVRLPSAGVITVRR